MSPQQPMAGTIAEPWIVCPRICGPIPASRGRYSLTTRLKRLVTTASVVRAQCRVDSRATLNGTEDIFRTGSLGRGRKSLRSQLSWLQGMASLRHAPPSIRRTRRDVRCVVRRPSSNHNEAVPLKRHPKLSTTRCLLCRPSSFVGLQRSSTAQAPS